MKQIYKPDNITEAHIIAGMLKSQGIEAYVGGYYLQGGVGELMAADFASVHVADEQAEEAKIIIKLYESKQKQNPACNSKKSQRASWPYWVLFATLMVITFFYTYK